LRAADLDPYCHRIFIGLGTVALQAKHYNVAVPQFHKAIALAPKDDMANLGLGLAFEGLSEAEQSLKWTVRACELNVENKPALYHLVKLSHELNVFDDAIRITLRQCPSLRCAYGVYIGWALLQVRQDSDCSGAHGEHPAHRSDEQSCSQSVGSNQQRGEE
jgi:lipopolysaccharide biosynthesis regulator YciM